MINQLSFLFAVLHESCRKSQTVPQSGFAAPPDNRVSRSTNTTETGIKQAGTASRAQNRTKTTAEGRPADFNPVYQNGRDSNA